ncbi:hypothetical protein [Serratia marcescens]|nr:hypothetical protein [Serratia marcescens]
MKAAESANALIFPSKSFNSSCIINLIIVLKRAYGRQLSLRGVAIGAERRPLPANCGEKGHKTQKLCIFSEHRSFFSLRSSWVRGINDVIGLMHFGARSAPRAIAVNDAPLGCEDEPELAGECNGNDETPADG